MADRYWVGGSGTWSSTTKWSTTSNGSSGASVPTAADNAIFDASSDSGADITVTFTAAATCLNLTMSAIDQNLTFTGAFTLSVVGNLSLSATKTIDVTGITALSMTGTTTRTITSSGGTLTGGITFNGSGGTFTLQDALTLSGTATLTNGTLALSSYTFTCSTFSSSNGNTRTISFGTGKIVITSAATATVWTTATTTGLSVSGTPLVELTGGGATTKTISAGALSEANSISFQLSTTAGTVAFTASNTVRNLTIANNSFTLSNITLTIYGNLTINGTSPTLTTGSNVWTFAATSGTKTITTNGETLVFPVTFNGVGGTWQLQDALSVGDGTTARTLTLTNGTLDLSAYTLTIFGQFSSSNSNTRTVNFGTGKIVLAMAGATNISIFVTNPSTNLTFTGTTPVEVVGSGTLTRTITADTSGVTSAGVSFSILTTAGTVTFGSTGRINNLTYNCTNTTVTGGPSLFGNLTMLTTVSSSSSGNHTMIGSSKTITSNGNIINFPIVIDVVSGTITLNDALTLDITSTTNGALTLTNGTLNLNNFTATLNRFSSTNTNTRSIAFGTSGKILVSGTGTTTSSAIYMDTMGGFSFSGTSNIEANITTAAVTQGIRQGVTSGATQSNVMNFTLTGTTGTQQLLGSVKDLTLNTDAIFTTNTTAYCYGNLNHIKVSLTASTGSLTFASTSGTKTITSNGQILLYPILFDGAGGTWQLQDALSVGNATSRTVTLTSGTLDLNSYTMTIFGIFSSDNSNTRRIQTTGSGGKIVLSLNTTTTVWSTTTATNMTTDGNILVQLTGGGATTKTISAAGLSEANSISFQLSNTAGTVAFTASNTVRNLTIDNNSFTVSNIALTIYGNLIIGGTTVTLSAGANVWTFAATSGTKTITTNGKTIDFPVTFNGVGGTWQLQDALSDGTSTSRTVTLTNGALDLNGFTFTIFGQFSSSNSNARTIAFGTTGKIVLSATGATTTTLCTMTTETNLTVTGTNPLFQVTGSGVGPLTVTSTSTLIDLQLSPAAGATIAVTGNVKSFTIDNSGNITLSNGTRSIYGNLTIGGTSPILTAGASVTTFAATSGTKTITTNGETLVFPITFDGVGGTWSLQDALTMDSSRVITLTNGTFNLNNYTCTAAGGFTFAGSGSKVLAHGTGDLVISLAGATAFNGNFPSITDGSAAPVTIINNGTATYNDDVPFSGAGGSISFNGTNQYLSTSANNGFLFDAGNFTIEAWIRPTSVATARGIANNWQIGGAFEFSFTASAYLKFNFTNAASGISTVGFTGTTQQVTANSWNHVAVVRNGNTITFYVNGVADATTFNATGMTMYYYNGSGKDLRIGVGADLGATTYFPGEITNFRIVKGTAVYTANFTPPASQLTAVSGTSILVQQTNTTAGTLTSTGTGKINMTSATAKTFLGGSNSYATLNQGGAGTLTIAGTNTFQNITNSVQPATVLFKEFTTNTFTNDFDLNGTSGNLITIGSATPASTYTLSKSSGTVDVSFCSISDSIATGGASWQSFTSNGNVDGGNNTGWSFAGIVLAAFLLLF